MNEIGYQMKERNKAIPAVYLFLVKGREILLGLRHNTGYQDGNWSVPSGHVESGELPTNALIREAKEEIGVDVISEYLYFVHASYRPKHDLTGDRCDFYFVSHHWNGEITNKEPEKCKEWKWFDVYALPNNMIPYVKLAIHNAGLYMGQTKHYSECSQYWLKEKGLYKLEESRA